MLLRISVFYGLTWFFLFLLGGIQQESGLFPTEIGLAQWGPGVAALLMLLIFRKDGHKIIFVSKDTPISRYAFAVLIPAAVGLMVWLIKLWISVPSPAAGGASLWLTVLWMPLGALGEEIGWRGYLHKKLDARLRGWISSFLVGILWAPIHVHFFADGPVFLLFFALTIISYSVVIYALTRDTGFSVALATIFHLSINLTNLLFLDVIHETSFMMVNGVVWAVAAVVVLLLNRKAFFAPKS
jgi:membrane protease YdiL (CAAX protease family)